MTENTIPEADKFFVDLVQLKSEEINHGNTDD